MNDPSFLRRVRLKNYRSIGACDVRLGPLTFLVGPNGSGKSNFLDAMRFVADALNNTLDHAVRERGGLNEVRRRSSGHPTNLAIRVDFSAPFGTGHYGFEITAAQNGAWSVTREEAAVATGKALDPGFQFAVEKGQVVDYPKALGVPPASSSDRLLLVGASGSPPFRPLFEALTRMGFYNLSPSAMRELQPPDPRHLLRRDGANIASALAQLEQLPERKQRLVDYLSRVVPGVVDVAHKALGPRETVEFRQRVQGAREPWRFLAQNMSDGTLRALGVLVALQQPGNGHPVPVVGIEEPETALHPAAVGVLLDALRDAASHTQVIATSHSAELLDDKDVPDHAVLAVTAEDNETRIGPLDAAGRASLKARLYTVGELLRMNELRPDEAEAKPKQLQLFGPSSDEP
jgi:predicted ATPase